MMAHRLPFLCLSFFLQLDCSLALSQTTLQLIQSDGRTGNYQKASNKHQHIQGTEGLVVQVPTGRPDKNETAAEATGVAQNAAGDLSAFVAALITNVVTIIVFWVVASFLRQRYPLVFSKEAMTLNEDPQCEDVSDVPDDVREIINTPWQTKVPFLPSNTLFGWWTASARVTIDEMIAYRGLDQAMLMQFAELAQWILLVIGIPLVFIFGPCHCFFGGWRAGAPGTEGADYLSYWGMANVKDGHPWLYWAHAGYLWITVITVQRMIYNAMRVFMKRRTEWLMAMPAPRSTTVLVEGIPEESRSDKGLKAYFDRIFGSSVVERAYCVKDTSTLLPLVAARQAALTEVDSLKHKVATQPTDDNKHALSEAEAKLTAIQQDTRTRTQEVLQAAEADEPGANVGTAFVTFKTRRDAELAKMMVFRADASEFVISIPPDPADVIYADLQKDPLMERIRMLIGYALIAGVYWAYLPTVVGIAYFTSLETLAQYFPTMKAMAEDAAMSALWDGLVNSLALQLFVAFVPTFFVLIFSNFFVLKAEAWLQQKIQGWYFWFLVVFVLLVTAIGSSLVATLEELAENPLSIFSLLAQTLPLATHFYLNYLPLQWVTHAQNLLRGANLFKFKAFSTMFGVPIAIKKCEPEDQDYYGLGSRSARFTFLLVLVLNFGSLSPLITILGFINFWICRKVYGYLVVFCEKKKPDLGGPFYVHQLRHVQEGLFFYIILMTGVLLERNANMYPGLIAAGALVFQKLSYDRFYTTFRWESLSFEELEDLRMEAPKTLASRMCRAPGTASAASAKYEQPELR